MFRLLRNFRFQPAVGDGGLRDLYLRADIPGGELFCQYSHRRGDHRGYLRVHEGSAPGIFPCSDYGGWGGDVGIGLRIHAGGHWRDPGGGFGIPFADHEALHGALPGGKSVPGRNVLGDDGVPGKSRGVDREDHVRYRCGISPDPGAGSAPGGCHEKRGGRADHRGGSGNRRRGRGNVKSSDGIGGSHKEHGGCRGGGGPDLSGVGTYGEAGGAHGALLSGSGCDAACM